MDHGSIGQRMVSAREYNTGDAFNSHGMEALEMIRYSSVALKA